MKNEAKGYKAEKENNLVLPKINNDKSQLQKNGAAILAVGNPRYGGATPQLNKNDVLNQIYGSNNPSR
jgi:hypothetical protein